MGETDAQARKRAAKLFVYKGWNVAEIAEELDVDPDRVRRWRRNACWDDKLMEYLIKQQRLKNYLGALKIKLAREAFKTLESKRISDIAALLRAEAGMVKAGGSGANEEKLSPEKLRKLIRDEYGT